MCSDILPYNNVTWVIIFLNLWGIFYGAIKNNERTNVT